MKIKTKIYKYDIMDKDANLIDTISAISEPAAMVELYSKYGSKAKELSIKLSKKNR